MREGIDGLNDPSKLGAHASAVVHDKADGYGSVSLIEHRYILRLAFFKYVKVFPLQTGYKCSARISDIDGKKNKAAAHRNFRLVLGSNGLVIRDRVEES
jgi:hypothetical protein